MLQTIDLSRVVQHSNSVTEASSLARVVGEDKRRGGDRRGGGREPRMGVVAGSPVKEEAKAKKALKE